MSGPPAAGELLCAMDVGTSGVKVGLLTPDGRQVASGFRECRVARPRPGHAEQPVAEVWAALCAATAEAVSGIGDPARVAGVAVSSQRATFVPVGADREPLTAWLSWQDRRGAGQCDRLRAVLGKDYYEVTGLAIEPTAPISKVMWLREERPEVFEAAVFFATHQTMILRQLGVEEALCPYSDASYTGFLDVHRRRWSAKLCAMAGISAGRLGTLVESATVVGGLSAAAAAATGLRPGTPIVAGGGDLQCGALGVGAVEPGIITVGIGSGGHCVAFLPAPLLHPDQAMSCQAHVVPGAWELEGIAMASASSFRWLRDELGGPEVAAAGRTGADPYDLLTAAAAGAPPGSDGLLVIPALNGAGAPLWDPAFQGTILGLNLTHSRAALIRAFLEGVCYEQRLILESMSELGVAGTEIRLWGGAAKSRLWTQIFADVFARPVVRAPAADAGLVGAAILAAVGTGLHGGIDAAVAAMVGGGQRYEPDPAAEVYEGRYEAYKLAVHTLQESGLYRRLPVTPP